MLNDAVYDVFGSFDRVVLWLVTVFHASEPPPRCHLTWQILIDYTHPGRGHK